jgi:hypothetical protein
VSVFISVGCEVEEQVNLIALFAVGVSVAAPPRLQTVVKKSTFPITLTPKKMALHMGWGSYSTVYSSILLS